MIECPKSSPVHNKGAKTLTFTSGSIYPIYTPFTCLVCKTCNRDLRPSGFREDDDFPMFGDQNWYLKHWHWKWVNLVHYLWPTPVSGSILAGTPTFSHRNQAILLGWTILNLRNCPFPAVLFPNLAWSKPKKKSCSKSPGPGITSVRRWRPWAWQTTTKPRDVLQILTSNGYRSKLGTQTIRCLIGYHILNLWSHWA